MTAPFVQVVYHDNTFTLPERYKGHPPDRLTSTPGDNIAEFSARLCYDSLMNDPDKARPTPEYHAHIHKYKHHSVYAHANETFVVNCAGYPEDLFDYLLAVQGRPGVHVTSYTDHTFSFSLSLRAVIEWDAHGALCETENGFGVRVKNAADRIRYFVDKELRRQYPLTLGDNRPPLINDENNGPDVTAVRPRYPKEQWCSLYIESVSRDLLQELVRHHYQANPSVRSTRYVDEQHCSQILHPAHNPSTARIAEFAAIRSRVYYRTIYQDLIKSGVDKKTARGAARSVLPGATETRLVYSLSLFQAKHILNLRLNQATGSVDPEIAWLAGRMRDALKGIGWNV